MCVSVCVCLSACACACACACVAQILSGTGGTGMRALLEPGGEMVQAPREESSADRRRQEQDQARIEELTQRCAKAEARAQVAEEQAVAAEMKASSVYHGRQASDGLIAQNRQQQEEVNALDDSEDSYDSDELYQWSAPLTPPGGSEDDNR